MGFSRVKVYEDDNKWAWKFVLRILSILLDIIGIALTASVLTTALSSESYNEDYGGLYRGVYYAFITWNLIPFSLSVIWCLTNLCILLSRSHPIHPGANVGCDLFLWLCFIVTGFFSTIGAVNAVSPYYNDSSNYYNSYNDNEYGYYPNGTSYIISPSTPAPPCPGFDSCAQKDSLIARQKKIGVVIMTASAIAFLMVLVHFALFVSACRYTHQRRRERYAVTNEKVTKEATVIAREIIAQMAQEGRLPPAQQPLLATEEPTRGHSMASQSPSIPVPQQYQNQPVPEIVVHGANPEPVADDEISHAPRG